VTVKNVHIKSLFSKKKDWKKFGCMFFFVYAVVPSVTDLSD